MSSKRAAAALCPYLALCTHPIVVVSQAGEHPVPGVEFLQSLAQAGMKYGDEPMKSLVRATRSGSRSFTARTYHFSLACFVKLPT
jgi:hypothetical protein